MVKKLKTAIILQARETSMRFPNKVYALIKGKPLILRLLSRLKNSKLKNQLVTAIPNNKSNDKLNKLLKKNRFNVFRGDEKNVLKRYFYAAKKYKANIVVRITADCPLADPNLIDKFIFILKQKKLDYLSNTLNPTYPDGLDIEVFTFSSLKLAFKNAKTSYDKEHVTPYIKRRKDLKKLNIKNNINLSNLRCTVDEKSDLIPIEYTYNKLKNNFNWEDISQLIKKNKNIFISNSNVIRNEGANLSSGQKMWIRAQDVIPGGTMLFSKNPDLFLPKKWPAYFSKAKGCHIWDLDNNKFLDMSYMGVGTNALGYANQKIDKKVIDSIKNSNMSTLNSTYEITLAEKLISIHNWADKVRFTRSGGEANAVAIRLARAFTKKDNIAICGYHGWHDWYLSSNLSNQKNLDKHLLKDLNILGVPKKLKGTVFPFKYNDFSALKKLIKNKKIGTIKMEVVRNVLPKNNFLKKVRNLATKNNIVLIFDECTSGFRGSFGGVHKLYGVNPDIAIFGKAIGNGYAINAIIGKKAIMDMANQTFISSTFWTEKIGYVAAISTIDEMKRIKSWEKINKAGSRVKNFWVKNSKKYKIKIVTQGLNSLPSFYIDSKNWLQYKTLISQELLKDKILGSNAFYPSIFHENKVLKRYFSSMNKIFKLISLCEKNKKSINELLNYPVALSGFKRLN